MIVQIIDLLNDNQSPTERWVTEDNVVEVIEELLEKLSSLEDGLDEVKDLLRSMENSG